MQQKSHIWPSSLSIREDKESKGMGKGKGMPVHAGVYELTKKKLARLRKERGACPREKGKATLKP